MTVERTVLGPEGVSYEKVGPQRGTVGIEANPDDIMTTARTTTGRPLSPAQITEDTLLTTRSGIQAPVRELLNAGVISRNQDGTYSEGRASPAQARTVASATANYEEPTHEPLPQNTEELFGETLKLVSDTDVATALTEMAMSGEITEATLDRLGQNLPGLERPGVRQIFGLVARTFHQQAADAVLKSQGVQLDDAVEWAREFRPDLLRRAMNEQFYGRNLNAYRELARQYATALGKVDQAVALQSQVGHGCRVFRSSNRNDILVQMPNGMTTTWENYIRMRSQL